MYSFEGWTNASVAIAVGTVLLAACLAIGYWVGLQVACDRDCQYDGHASGGFDGEGHCECMDVAR